MESELFDRLRDLSQKLCKQFDKSLQPYSNDKHIHHDDLPGWSDYFWKSKHIRKAHLKTIEPVGKNKMWLMHINVFPEFNCDLPIFGLDIVATPTKVSGVFCDYSKIHDGVCTKLYQTYFHETVKDLSWKRERELPPWAQEIFSDDMMAAGTVKVGEELDQLCDTAIRLQQFYLEMLPRVFTDSIHINTVAEQNKYCRNQKMNKMLHGSILAMGIPEEIKDQYVDNVLFEQV
tara:strand:- start:44 stop:739 length:696 start_codon:yes stop_codon:yes gene_type:complete